MADLIPLTELPRGFEYPREFVRVVELGLTNRSRGGSSRAIGYGSSSSGCASVTRRGRWFRSLLVRTTMTSPAGMWIMERL